LRPIPFPDIGDLALRGDLELNMVAVVEDLVRLEAKRAGHHVVRVDNPLCPRGDLAVPRCVAHALHLLYRACEFFCHTITSTPLMGKNFIKLSFLPDDMRSKVLIGIVTHDGDSYCLPELAKTLELCTYANRDVLVIDNSNGDEYKARLEGIGLRVIRDNPEGTRIERIIRGRNLARRAFLESDADYLFFLDSDVIMRPDYLARLVAHGKDIVSGLYLANFIIDGKQQILPVAYERVDDRRVRHMLRHEIQEEHLIPVGCAGLGCVLLSQRVMKKISFRNIGESTTGGEDAAFYKDAIMAGFTPYCDTSIKCLHMKYPRGDARNKIFAW